MRDPFDYQFDLLADDLIQESADAKRSQWTWYVRLALIVLAALGILWAIHSWNVKTAQSNLGGEEGVLYDGVYYIYAGSGLSLPNETRVPRGIFAYTPGQEPELLVSTEDYMPDTLFPSWNVNSHGLYFIDLWTNNLYRMDLDTRELALLYDLPEAPDPLEETEDMTWQQVLSGEYRETREAAQAYHPYVLLNGLWEDRIALICDDGVERYYLTLDCRTGEILSREEDDQRKGWNLVAGERTLEQYQVDYPEGTEYPNWEFDVEHDLYYYTDLREKGESLLPPGTQIEDYETRAIGDGILVVYHPFEDYGQWSAKLFLADGADLDLPKDTEGIWRQYLAVSGKWLFYTETREAEKNGVTIRRSTLQAMDLDAGETYLVQEDMNLNRAVTDGVWFYTCGDATDCYKLEYTPEGIPCGLTLVENDI